MSDPKPEDAIPVEKIEVTSKNIDYVAGRTGLPRKHIVERYMAAKINDRPLVIYIKGDPNV